MGSLFSKKSSNRYNAIDANNDGIITKREFSVWEERIKRLENERVDKVIKLENENEALKRIKQRLEKENVRLMKIVKSEECRCKTEEEANSVSRVIIRDYVSKMLEEDAINIDYFPDYVESAIYENIFMMVLSMMKHMGDETSLKLLGHEIGMSIKGGKDKKCDKDVTA